MVWRICENESYQSKIPGYHGVTEMDWCENTIMLHCNGAYW